MCVSLMYSAVHGGTVFVLNTRGLAVKYMLIVIYTVFFMLRNEYVVVLHRE